MKEKHNIQVAFSSMAPRYEEVVDRELRTFWGWSYDGFIENMLNKTVLHDNDAVLDVATGTAVIPLKLVNRGKVGGEILGLDITLAMLKKARQNINANAGAQLPVVGAQSPSPIRLTCASAMAMPYIDNHFDVVLCALATHHLDVPVVLAEMARVLKPGGRLTIADVIGLPLYQLPVIKFFVSTATLLYFLPRQGLARAKAEASALAHIYTQEEWEQNLKVAGMDNIKVELLPKSHSWSPAPIVVQAQKKKMEG